MSDPDRAHQIVEELVVYHLTLLAAADVQDLPDRLMTGDCTRKCRRSVGGMDELEPCVGADPESGTQVVRSADQADGHGDSQPENAPLQARLLDGLLALHLVSTIVVGGGDRRLHAERGLAILDVAEHALGRGEDEPPGRRRGLHLLDQAPGRIDVDPPREIGRLRHVGRDDGRQVHHCVHAVQRRADRR